MHKSGTMINTFVPRYNPFCRDDNSDSEDDYADIYQGLSFGRKLPLKTVQVIINSLPI